MNNKKAKKSLCPRASTGNTHHGMRYAGEKLFSNANISNFLVNYKGGYNNPLEPRYIPQLAR